MWGPNVYSFITKDVICIWISGFFVFQHHIIIERIVLGTENRFLNRRATMSSLPTLRGGKRQ